MFSYLSAATKTIARPSRYRLTRRRLEVEGLESRCQPSTAYLATDLISDQPGVAPTTDPTLVNAWGISLSPNGGAFWVSSADAGLSEVYVGDFNGSPISQPFKVTIPGGSPTGQVFNGTGSTTDFVVTDGTNSRASTFIFATEEGTIAGWNAAVGVVPGMTGPSRIAEVPFTAGDGAIYKGLALAKVGAGNFLFAADFHNGKIDVLDGQFHLVTLGANAFTDPDLPSGYAPFNVAAIGGKIYVAYAKQDADAEDEVAGNGRGFVSVFDTNGDFQGRLISQGALNAPWALVQATADFGDFSNALLVGNFGDGRINAYDIQTGAQLGTLSQAPGQPLVIDGLWGLAFGNGRTAGDANSLYYAAGPEDETHGLFGKITANPAGTNPVSATQKGSDLVITGSRDSDVVKVGLSHHGQTLTVRAGGKEVGKFDAGAIATIHFSGFAGNDAFVVHPHVEAVVFADGGAGNDFLKAGAGGSVLLGNAGDDLLLGGFGRDVLIGGDGHDLLLGRFGQDLLIGGKTNHDSKPDVLASLFAAWNNPTASYNDRVAAIRAGVGGVPKLDSTTVIDDGVRDDLIGGKSLDWFFVGLDDRRHGHKRGEAIN